MAWSLLLPNTIAANDRPTPVGPLKAKNESLEYKSVMRTTNDAVRCGAEMWYGSLKSRADTCASFYQ